MSEATRGRHFCGAFSCERKSHEGTIATSLVIAKGKHDEKQWPRAWLVTRLARVGHAGRTYARHFPIRGIAGGSAAHWSAHQRLHQRWRSTDCRGNEYGSICSRGVGDVAGALPRFTTALLVWTPSAVTGGSAVRSAGSQGPFRRADGVGKRLCGFYAPTRNAPSPFSAFPRVWTRPVGKRERRQPSSFCLRWRQGNVPRPPGRSAWQRPNDFRLLMLRPYGTMAVWTLVEDGARVRNLDATWRPSRRREPKRKPRTSRGQRFWRSAPPRDAPIRSAVTTAIPVLNRLVGDQTPRVTGTTHLQVISRQVSNSRGWSTNLLDVSRV